MSYKLQELLMLFISNVPCSLFLFLFVERKFKPIAKMVERLGKLVTIIINTILSMFLMYIILPLRDYGLVYTFMFGVVFSFYMYSAVSIYTTSMITKNINSKQ